MPVELLSASQSELLRHQPLTYAPVGLSGDRPTPPGYASFARTRRLPAGPSFAERVDALLTWQVQLRAGLRVAASALRVESGAVVVMRFGVAAAAVRIPCRVVAAFEEDDRAGFAYGTLPGHPESGEEAFVVARLEDGGVEFTVSAASRPASALARLGGPLTTAVQRWMTGRYLAALD